MDAVATANYRDATAGCDNTEGNLKGSIRMGRVLVAAALTVLLTVPLLAQEGAQELEKTVSETVDIHQSIQKEQDTWEVEKAELIVRYKTARVNVEYLSGRKSVEEKTLGALESSIAELKRCLNESIRLQESLQDTLNAILNQLDCWVDGDLPFLIDERKARILNLKEELVKPDVDGSEKMRRILEALQVEAGYGGSVEVDQQGIDINGEKLYVDILRVGRISLFWRTPDGKRVGEYDRATAQWVELPGKFNRNIGNAMEMATRMRPVELLSLPLGRIHQ